MPKQIAHTTVRFVNAAQAARPATALRHDILAAPGRVVVDYRTPGRRTVLVPVKGTPTLKDVREGLHKAMGTLRELKVPAADVILPTHVARYSPGASCLAMPIPGATGTVPAAELERLSAQWALGSQYRYTRMLTTDTEPHAADIAVHTSTSPPRTERRALHAEPLKAAKAAKLSFFRGITKFNARNVKAGEAVAHAVARARTLGNLRPDDASPEHIAEVAEEMVMYNGVSVRAVLDKAELKKQGLGLLHAVGQAAVRPPVLIVLEYTGAPANPATTALVGKGVTMDTGGLNVKPFGSMETMHMDMMGAAAVLGAFEAVAQRQLPVNVVCALGLAENAVGSAAFQPSQILRSLRGTTVEVTNTDAEGRLVLADAMTYVQTKLPAEAKKVDTVIDVATLTGACMVALGDRRAGLFSNDAALRGDLYAAGERALEPLWPLPVGPEHERKLKGTMSDLINCTPGRYAGASTAAAFLKHFVNKNVRWAHLDIAGPGCGEKPTGTQPAGAPGFGVQLLTEYFISQAAKKPAAKRSVKTKAGKRAAKNARKQ